MLADVNARHARRNRLEFAPDIVGRGGLHIPTVQLTWPAVQQEQDAGTSGMSRPREFAGTQQSRQRNADAGKTAEAQPVAA